MRHPAFGESWADAWAGELRASDAYRQAAVTWEGSLVLEMTTGDADGDEADRAVFVDLWHGECRGARVATDDDRSAADYAIRADVATWRRARTSRTGRRCRPRSGAPWSTFRASSRRARSPSPSTCCP